MIGEFFKAIIYQPLYNGLIFLLDLLPLHDVGLAVILLTIIVKLILLPLSLKSVRTQQALKEVQPEIDAIKEKHKDDPQTQALKTFELYRERKIKPFSGILLLLIQLPVILSLYYVFLRGGLPNINFDLLYSFIHVPETIHVKFLGLFDVREKSLILALLTGITQYIQMSVALPSTLESETKQVSNPMAGFASKMRYIFPPLVTIIAYSLSGAIALYWITSNIFHLVQEVLVKRRAEIRKVQN